MNFSATAGGLVHWPRRHVHRRRPGRQGRVLHRHDQLGRRQTSAGTITGIGTLTASGSHTYADPAIDAAIVQISHKLGNTTTTTVYPTANVTSLGLDVQHGLTGGIGYWHGKNGQALINGFNGGSTATSPCNLAVVHVRELCTEANAGVNNLTGKTNAQVAAFFQTQFAVTGSNLDADVLATALNTYATTVSLGGTHRGKRTALPIRPTAWGRTRSTSATTARLSGWRTTRR